MPICPRFIAHMVLPSAADISKALPICLRAAPYVSYAYIIRGKK